MQFLERNITSVFILTKNFVDTNIIPPYAILSHTWNEGDEATYKDLMDITRENKTGYNKIRFCEQ